MKKIWSYSTAVEVAAVKSQKHGVPFKVVPAPGGGHYVVQTVVAPDTAMGFAAGMGISVVQVTS